MNGGFIKSYGLKALGNSPLNGPSAIYISASGAIIVSEIGLNQHLIQFFE
jgi:hypothetical protein